MNYPAKSDGSVGLAEADPQSVAGSGRGKNAVSGTQTRSGSQRRQSVLESLINFFASLRLTVVLLGLGLVLVFTGTLAQVDLGLYKAQNEFFRSFVVYWGPKGATWRLPVLPGGYTLGTMLLLNLVTAHFKRFKLTRKKIGIWMTHVGLMLLLLGQLLTDMLSRETHMWLKEGQTKNYSDSSSKFELAVVDTSNPDYDDVVTFPAKLVKQNAELSHAKLPFKVRVKEFYPNSEPQVRAPMMSKGPPQASNGIAKKIEFVSAPLTASMNSQNIPSTVVEVLADQKSLGTWVLSDWLTEEESVQYLQDRFQSKFGEQLGSQLGAALSTPQEFEFQGHTYQLAFRPVRYYKDFNIQLQKFNHDLYRGTDVPKNFSSRIRLSKPATGEDREVLIYMNNPLRYAGETFYQAGFGQFDPHVTILQVVRNPSWLTPYLSCVMVGGGLVVQFLTHLIGFVRKRKTA